MDQTTNTQRISDYFEKKFGVTRPYDGSETLFLEERSVIFPSSFFCTPENGKKNYCVHHFNGSWIDAYTRKNLFLFMNYKVIRFKKRPEVARNDLPLLSGEKVIFEWNVSSKKRKFVY